MTTQINKIPKSIGVIIDGNRRWAKEKGYPTFVGHKAGYDKFIEFIDWANESGVSLIYAYCFSTENWKRSADEVGYLMNLIRDSFLGSAVDSFKTKGYRIHIAGALEMLPEDIQKLIIKAEKQTANCDQMDIVLCISYGGQDEIIAGINSLLKDETTKKHVTKEIFEKYLWTAGYAEPDMIIRTSGEQRLSNFLTWKSVYSELFFPNIYFPDLTKQIFQNLLEEYSERDRRKGK